MQGYPWVKLRTASLNDFRRLQASALHVFLVMVQHTKDGGFVYLSQAQIKKLAKVSQGAASKALKVLADEQFIQRLGKDAYRLNPRYVEVGRKVYKPKLPGLVDTSTGVIKKFKVKPIENAANLHHT